MNTKNIIVNKKYFYKGGMNLTMSFIIWVNKQIVFLMFLSPKKFTM
jgi:hypothetical protein